MRAEWSNLVGRDHLSFRSYYVPVKVNKSHQITIGMSCT